VKSIIIAILEFFVPYITGLLNAPNTAEDLPDTPDSLNNYASDIVRKYEDRLSKPLVRQQR